MKKRLLSFLLALTMVLTMVPMAVFAEENSVRIYFDNTGNWDAVFAYFWNEKDSDMNVWPSLAPNPFEEAVGGDIILGEAMAPVEGTIWSIDIPADANRIIFINGETAQTDMLTIPSDGKDLYTYGEGWSAYMSCDHENTKIVCNGDETHSIVCAAESCGKVIDTENCTFAEGRCVCGQLEMKILVQPVNDYVAIGEAYKVSVTAVGEGLKYQWYLQNEGIPGWGPSAVKTSIYRGIMTNARANREVYCVITDAYGNQIVSDTVKLELKPTELKITQQPQDDAAATKESFQVTVKAVGDGLTYQWYVKNAGSDVWFTSAVRSASYKGSMSDATAGRQLKCVITDKYGYSVESEVATLNRIPTELKIITQPVDDEAALKEGYNVFVVAEGDGLTYQWYLCNDGTDKWGPSAVKSRKYSGTMTRARANRQVYCIITDAYGNQVQTDTVTLHCPDVQPK